jgi:hypothetical protein
VVVSAVEDATGKLLWQTQLGLVAVGEPLRLKPQAGPETLLLMDEAGALHHLPASLAAGKGPWQGIETQLAPALAENSRWRPRLLMLAGGSSALQVAAPGDGTRLVVRRVSWDKGNWAVETHELDLTRRSPAGSVALVADHLIVPLTDGVVYRLPVPLGEKPALQPGPNWRSRYLGPETPAFVVGLGAGVFATSDGAKVVEVFDWPAEKDREKSLASTALPQQPVGTPLVLPAVGDRKPRFLVADQTGTLRCLEAQANGKLVPRKAWSLTGRATEGPFLATSPGEADRVCAVVDEAKLAWLDPATDEFKVWKVREPGGAIVGKPHRPGLGLLVATEGGRVLAFDPAAARETARQMLAGSISPTTTPILVGPQEKEDLLLPLTDGTLMLVPSSWLTGKK